MRLRVGELTELSSRGALPVLAIVVMGSALAMGGALAVWFLPFALLISAYAILSSFAAKERRYIAWPAVVMIALGVWSLVQALPLPIRWVAALSPQAGDVWSRCLLPIGERPTSGALSLDPSASMLEAVKWCSYGATFHVAAALGRRKGASAGLLVVFASAVLVALVSLAHAVFGATAVYGVYVPRNAHPMGLGPFLNPNNLCGYLNLGALVGLGLILSRHFVISRWLLGAGLLTIIAVALLTASRGGIATLILGSAAFGVWASFGRRQAIASGRVVSVAVSGLFIVGGLFAFLGADATFWSSLLSDNSAKLRMTSWTIPVVRDFPVFGVGRGAFESVFFAYRPPAGNVAYTHPENFLAQWTTEWGVPATIVATSSFIFTLMPLRRGAARSAMVMGALMGVAALLLQNLADLALELGAVSMVLVTVLGSLWGSVRTPNTNRRPRARRAWLHWPMRVGFALGIVAGVLFALRGASTVEEDRGRIRALIDVAGNERSTEKKQRLRTAIVGMLTTHPADYYFPLAGAFAARMLGENPMPWLQRALERGPTVGRTHLLLGDILAARGLLNQGMLELQIGVGYEPGMATVAASIAVSRTQAPEVLLRAAPDGSLGATMLEAMAARLPETAADARDALDTEALVRDEALVEPRRRLMERRLVAIENNEPVCANRVDCEDFVEQQAAALSRIAPTHTLSARGRARLLRARGRSSEAADLLSTACAAPIERPACLQLRVEILVGGAPDALNAAIDAYLDGSCADRKQCATASDWVAELRLKNGQVLQAVSARERAVREEPTAERWLKLADAAQQAGLNGTAIDALRQLLAMRGRDAGLEQRLSELERLNR